MASHHADPTETVESRWYGTMRVLRNDQEMSAAVRRGLLWERSLVEAYRSDVGPGDVVVDVGANIGCHTVSLASIVAEDGIVVAYEPQPFVASLLERNTRDRKASVVVRRAAVGATPGRVTVAPPDYGAAENPGGWSLDIGSRRTADRRVQLGVASIDVDVVTLDAEVDTWDIGARRIAMIKIDVEGAEVDVVRGAMEVLARHRPILYVEAREHVSELSRILGGLGYGPLTLVDTPARADYRAAPAGGSDPILPAAGPS